MDDSLFSEQLYTASMAGLSGINRRGGILIDETQLSTFLRI